MRKSMALRVRRRRLSLSTNVLAEGNDDVLETENEHSKRKRTSSSGDNINLVDDHNFDVVNNNISGTTADNDEENWFVGEELESTKLEEELELEEAMQQLQLSMPRRVATFEINDVTRAQIEEFTLRLQKSYLETLYGRGRESEFPIEEYTNDIRRAFHQLNITEAGKKLLLDKFCLPLVNKIPEMAKVIQKSLSRNKKEEKLSFLRISVCPNDCTVYCGVELSKLDRCPICHVARFTHCSKMRCRTRPYSQCRCRGYKDRIPHKSFYYRPILPLIFQLLTTKHFASFSAYGLQQTVCNPHSESGAYTYTSTSSGKEAQKQMILMHNTFLQYLETNGCADGDIVEISLLAADFFDGIQWNKTSVGHYYPLFLSFKNLPDRFHNRSGEGTFLIGFFTNKTSSVAVQTVFRDFVVEELLQIAAGTGLEMKVAGKRENPPRRIHFPKLPQQGQTRSRK